MSTASRVRFMSLAAAIALSFSASAAMSADVPCAAAKIKALAKANKSYTTCGQKLLVDNDFPAFYACGTVVADKITAAFVKAEAGGACSGTIPGCTILSGRCSNLARASVLSAATACQVPLLKVFGKYAKSTLQCDSSFYKGKTLDDVNGCQTKASTKLTEGMAKVETKFGPCAGPDAAAVHAAIDGDCEAAIAADLPDLPRLCQLCTQISHVPTSTTGFACYEDNADEVFNGINAALVEFTDDAPDYGFFADTNLMYCRGDTGLCAATAPTPAQASVDCCDFTVNGLPACSVSAATMTNQGHCTALSGTHSLVNSQCTEVEDGRSCSAP